MDAENSDSFLIARIWLIQHFMELPETEEITLQKLYRILLQDELLNYIVNRKC